MKASAFHEFGGPEVVQLIELPIPPPAAGEVVVRVAASTLNPTDLLMRSGQQAGLMKDLKPPFIAGMEFAGRIHHIGESQRLGVGDNVMGIVNPRRPQGGAHAEYICVPEASLAPLPKGCDLVAASTVPMNGLTAKMALEALGLAPGSTLLVTGGAGAVGGYVISLARLAGLQVIADAKESDRELLLSLGAGIVVPRGESMVGGLRKHYPDGVDAVVDCALLGDAAAALVRNGGSFVSLRRSQVVTDNRLRRITIGVLDQVTNTSALEWLAQRFADGTLRPRIAQQLPASRGADAHRLLEHGGMRGRVVIAF